MNAKPTSREWDASAYHRLSGPQATWGAKVVARLDLKGDEIVLDAGCGTGRLTASLIEVLPQGQVIAVDLSENMLIQARSHLAAVNGATVHYVCADLAMLPFSGSFDGVFSTASFHWVPDHLKLFRDLFQSLKAGGWLVAQCGGGPNLSRLRKRMHSLGNSAPYAAYLADFKEPWCFSDAETAAENLRIAGFEEIETSTEPAPTRFENAEHFSQFVRTAIVHRHLDRLPDARLQEEFLRALAEQAARDNPPFELDYWRLNLKARKPS